MKVVITIQTADFIGCIYLVHTAYNLKETQIRSQNKEKDKTK